LDPRIMYEGLKEEYSNDIGLLGYLEDAKRKLTDYYQLYYANFENQARSHTNTAGLSSQASSARFSFTSRYQKKTRQVVNELEDFFKLSSEPFEECDPLKWWLNRQSQYPNLYRLARDILAIP
ncbi:hypothetical protein H0H92_002299, partial [Tricholoma furcatifolium]